MDIYQPKSRKSALALFTMGDAHFRRSAYGMGTSRPSPLVDDLKEDVSCQVCLSVPRDPPVLQCDRGHILCSDCHPKCLDKCPSCQRPLGKIRSILADKLIALMPLCCRHVGCDEEFPRQALSAHERSCPFRTVRCVDIACEQQVQFAKMIQHMENDHEREDFVHANDSKYQSHFIVKAADFQQGIMWICDHLVLDNRHFFRECCRCEERRLWFIWVYVLGAPDETDKFVCTIKVHEKNSSQEISYRGRVNVLGEDTKPDLDSIAGLVFPDSIAKLFWHGDKIHYSVEVEKRAPRKSSVRSKSAQAAVVAPSSPTPSPTSLTTPSSPTPSLASQKDKAKNKEKDEEVKETPC